LQAGFSSRSTELDKQAARAVVSKVTGVFALLEKQALQAVQVNSDGYFA